MTSLCPTGVPTPATFVIVRRLVRNLNAMAAFARKSGIALRPHAKSHKCVEIANMQIDAGAKGMSVATIGEAEILCRRPGSTSTVDDIFISYPLWAADDTVSRLSNLTDRVRLSVGADSAEAVSRLAPLAGRLSVVIEIDSGLRRSGTTPTGAVEVARAVGAANLQLDGVFTFPGHSYLPSGASGAAEDEGRLLDEASSLVEEAGFATIVRSGGSTPSALHTRADQVNELRPGVYVFNDAQQVELGTVSMEDVALMVASTVVSRPAPGRIVLDAGSKVLGPDRPTWSSGHGLLPEWPGARIVGLWEHHAVVELEEDGPLLGETVAVVPNHVCTAVNLVPELLVVDDCRVVDRFVVAARGVNR
jgi:D-serine deaminase-like pyridoxal phosphate-dependent protein